MTATLRRESIKPPAMYHWFLILRQQNTSMYYRDATLGFFLRSDTETASLNHSERRKLFWLGAIESIPILLSALGASYTDSAAIGGGFVALGILLWALLCWLLRHHTPQTRIYSSEPARNHDKIRNA